MLAAGYEGQMQDGMGGANRLENNLNGAKLRAGVSYFDVFGGAPHWGATGSPMTRLLVYKTRSWRAVTHLGKEGQGVGDGIFGFSQSFVEESTRIARQ